MCRSSNRSPTDDDSSLARFARCLEEDFTRTGDLHMALRTNEESYANFLFKLFDLHAKRRLSDMQRSTRLAEVQMIGNCNRITKLSQFH
jgi:hypothetical protein